MRSVILWSTTLVLACAATVALAAEPAKKGTPPPMSPEQAAKMQAYTKASTPGPRHQALAQRVGKWDFAGKFWEEPNGPGQESKGAAERSMILGGRVLVEKVTSQFMGMPFEGQGMMGYDNVTGKFWSTWNDNMSTGMMSSHGTCEPGMARCEMVDTFADPLTGKETTTRSTFHKAGADKEVYTTYGKGPDGKEFKMMELTYTRKP